MKHFVLQLCSKHVTWDKVVPSNIVIWSFDRSVMKIPIFAWECGAEMSFLDENKS